jgi:hypothetical protein
MKLATRSCFVVLILSLLLSGCSSTGVIQENPDSYMVSATGTSPAFTGTEDAIKRAYRDAAAFCAEKRSVVETLSLEKVEQAIGRPGRATLHFRCVHSDKAQG